MQHIYIKKHILDAYSADPIKRYMDQYDILGF